MSIRVILSFSLTFFLFSNRISLFILSDFDFLSFCDIFLFFSHSISILFLGFHIRSKNHLLILIIHLIKISSIFFLLLINFFIIRNNSFGIQPRNKVSNELFPFQIYVRAIRMSLFLR